MALPALEVGDSFAVSVFRNAKRLALLSRRWPSPFALLVLLVGLSITAAVTYGLHRSSRERDAARFARHVEIVREQIRGRLDTYVALLLATRGFMSTDAEVTAEAFGVFVSHLGIENNYPGIQGVGFTARIASDERSALESGMQAQGREAFRIWPEHPRDELHAILYLEPLDRRNLAALGYDMSTEPTRAEAMARARDTGEPAASGPVTLVQEIDEDKQAGFLIYVPLYHGGQTPATVEERRAALRGFVYSPFRVDDLLDGILAGAYPRLAFDLYDTKIDEETLLHSGPSETGDPPRLQQIDTLPVAGRTWVLDFYSRPQPDVGSRASLVPWVLGSGVLFSFVLFGLTQLRSRQQEQLRLQASVLENMGEGVSVTDENGIILYTNPAEDRIFGYSPGELLGKPVTVQNSYPADENERLVAEVMQQLRRDGSWVGEFSNIKKDGTAFTTFARITALEVLGTRYFICVQEDVTQRKRIEQERTELLEREQSARAQAEAASRTKDEFIAMLGHELRNPLAPIVTALELMRRRNVQGIDRELELIARQVGHMVRLVDDLLDVARIARGKVLLKRRGVELATVTRKAIEIASPLLEQFAHRLVTELPPRGLRVNVDEVRFAQVIANLLTNAAKFTPPGGDIVVRAFRDAEQAVLSVRDNGRGIGPETLPRIFDLFAQGQAHAEAQATASPGGLGIGLTLVKSLVEMHDGQVTAHSEGLGTGSEFTLRVPIEPGAREAAPESLPVPATNGTAHRVIVVDDNRDAAEMLAELLRCAGHDVRVAHDGPEALRIADDFRPEVGVLDIGLPVMDGYELAQRMLDANPVHLVAVTGYGQEHDRERARQAGFAAHFVKPVDPGQLLAAMESLSGSESAR